MVVCSLEVRAVRFDLVYPEWAESAQEGRLSRNSYLAGRSSPGYSSPNSFYKLPVATKVKEVVQTRGQVMAIWSSRPWRIEEIVRTTCGLKSGPERLQFVKRFGPGPLANNTIQHVHIGFDCTGEKGCVGVFGRPDRVQQHIASRSTSTWACVTPKKDFLTGHSQLNSFTLHRPELAVSISLSLMYDPLYSQML